MFDGLLFWWRRHLTAKITAVALAFLTVLTGVSTWLLTSSERRVIREQMDAQGRSLLRAASIGCIEPLLSRDYPALDTLTQTLVDDRRDLVFVVVRRLDGTIVSQCPADAAQAIELHPNRVYSSEIRAPETDNVIGTIAIGIATRITDEFVAARIMGIAFGATVALVQMALILAWTLRKVVGEPLHHLDERATRLGRGDLNTPVHVASKDELGRLAATLDQMRRNLRSSYEELREQNRELKQLDQMKDEFLANMSHEIRTPLTAILGFADVLMDTIDKEEERQSVQIVKRNGDHLLQIINDILDLSKIQAGKFHVVRRACCPAEIISDVASLMRVRAQAKGLSLDVRYHGPIPSQIQTDSTRVRQVLINLVGNAIKFTDQGSVSIETRLERSENSPDRIRFDVVDTGVGLTDEEVAKLFRPFYQVDSSMSRNHGGTGLGLAISKHIAELLDGELTVTSKCGRGSTFALTISTGPLQGVDMLEDGSESCVRKEKASDAAAPGAASDAASDDSAPASELGARILLAEDGPDNQRLISYVLRKAGFAVTVADDGKVAVELYTDAEQSGQPFDLVLMDIQMPVMDGYVATRKLRECGYTGPIVAVTAHAMSADCQKCRDVGCNDYLTKPIDPKRFVETVTRYIRENNRELAAQGAESRVG